MNSPMTGCILVVDDQENWRKALTDLLTKDGHSVMTAASFEEADVALAKTQFDIVVLDVRLVDNDIFNVYGLELLQKIKAQKNAPRVMILTGYPESIHDGILEKYGADSLVLKVPPGTRFDSRSFTKQIQSLLQTKV